MKMKIKIFGNRMEKFVLLISTVKLEKSLRLIQLINTKSLKFFLRIFRVRSTYGIFESFKKYFRVFSLLLLWSKISRPKHIKILRGNSALTKQKRRNNRLTFPRAPWGGRGWCDRCCLSYLSTCSLRREKLVWPLLSVLVPMYRILEKADISCNTGNH